MSSFGALLRKSARQGRLFARRSAGRKLRRGLTLVELAIVVLVLGIIMTIVISSIDFGIVDDAKKLQVRSASKTVELALRRYEMEHSGLQDGTKLGMLAQKDPNDPSWRPVEEELVRDPWGEEYFICMDTSGQRQICTYGADKAPGGEGNDQDFYLTDKASWPDWLKSSKDKGEN